MKPDESIELKVDSLSYGPAAVSRVDGRVIFIEGAAPGDRVLARIRAEHPSYDEAELVEVIRDGPHRVAPPCPIAGRCGGCPWQHVDYNTQLGAKRTALVDCLERIAGIDRPPVAAIVASPQTEGYRNRIKLRFDGTRLGFYRARTHSIVEVTDCLIAEPGIRAALPAAAEAVRALRTQVTRVEVIDRGLANGVVLALNARGRLHPGDAATIQSRLSDAGNDIRGLTLWGRGWRKSWGDLERRIKPSANSHAVDFSGGSFGQVNTDANRLLVAEVLSSVAADADDDILELYAGSGNFSFALARAARSLCAVESDRAAVTTARRTIKREDVGNISFVSARVEDYLARAAVGGRARIETPAVVVLDPPRSGLGTAAKAVASIGAPRIVYVACQPATLARDLKEMLERGYRLTRAVPLDLFPHTFHVEAVCTLELT